MSITLTGIGIILSAAFAAGWLVQRRSADQEKLVKVIFFGLYFWGLVFLELIIAAVAYQFLDL